MPNHYPNPFSSPGLGEGKDPDKPFRKDVLQAYLLIFLVFPFAGLLEGGGQMRLQIDLARGTSSCNWGTPLKKPLDFQGLLLFPKHFQTIVENTLRWYTLLRYELFVAIQSFVEPSLKEFFQSEKLPKNAGWQGVKKIVRRKLDMLDYAYVLDDLASPPGNKLEALKGDLQGFLSIRINDQWRIVFEWTDQGPAKVRVVDYH